MRIIQETLKIASSLSPIPSIFAPTSDGDHDSSNPPSSSSDCHGFWHNAALVAPSALFILYLAFHCKKDLKKLIHGRSYAMIAYYALLWCTAILNLIWCSLQGWQCAPGYLAAWNALSLFTEAGMLCFEISLMAFVLKENYASALESLARTFLVSGLVVGVAMLLKVIFIFGFEVPLYVDSGGTTFQMKWGFLFIHELLLTGAYGFILFEHHSKGSEKLPPRPAFYNYIIVMFVFSGLASFASGLAGSGAGLGVWLYYLAVICYHSLYLPFLYVTFLADFFREEDWLLDNAYYSEMRDAGFFDDDWD